MSEYPEYGSYGDARIDRSESQTQAPAVPLEGEEITTEVVWVSQDYAKAVIRKNQELRAEIASLRSQQTKDVAYVDDMRQRLDRASRRIDEMTLVKQQQTERIKTLESQTQLLESALTGAERKGWNDCVEAAVELVSSDELYLERIRALRGSQ